MYLNHTPTFPENISDYAPWVARHGLLHPYGKCQCGCEEDAPIATITNPKLGQVRGLPRIFLHNHHNHLRQMEYAPWVAAHGLLEPYGKCQCGCGQDAGIKNGKPTRFARGHRIFFKSLQDAFWTRCNKKMGDNCWEWTGARSAGGYGNLGFRGVTYSAHRVSYEIHFGPIPNNLWVLHKCDNPSCANPDHLFLGTQQDNVDDMMTKGRHNPCRPIAT